MLDGLLRSAIFGVKRDLAAAYRADSDGRLKRALDPPVAEMVRSTGFFAGTGHRLWPVPAPEMLISRHHRERGDSVSQQ
jgi:hypothetical protein